MAKIPLTTELAQKNRIQTKILASNATADGVIADLTFNNLVVGKWYEISGQFTFLLDTGGVDNEVYVNFIHNGATIGRSRLTIDDATAGDDLVTHGVSCKFLATASTLTFSAVSATSVSRVVGNGSQSDTYIQLEERNNLEETSDFT